MPKKYFFLLLVIQPFIAFAQSDSLIMQFKTIAKDTKGKVSISAFVLEDSTSLNYYGDEMCVMQSVLKFPVALAILYKIDKGEFSMQHKIHLTSKIMVKDTWSPMRDAFPDGNLNMTFEKLLTYMVAQSDNIACDVLLNHLGKPKDVQKFISKLGFDDFEMKYNEAGLHKKWKNQYFNVCSPNMMTKLLTKFYTGEILSITSTQFLYQLMKESNTGMNRMVKLLPEGTVVAHKTGTSATNKEGMTAAVNDVGIIILPNNKTLILSVFVQDAYAEIAVLENTIAVITKLVFDEFNK